MSIITLCKINAFSRDKKSYKSTLILAWLWEITYVIPLFWLVGYLILQLMVSYFQSQIITNI